MARIVVKPNCLAYVFRNQTYSKTLGPGVYRLGSLGVRNTIYIHSTTECFLDTVNQEVLTKDAISLRLSYLVKYVIQDGGTLLKHLDLSKAALDIRGALESRMHVESQILIRKHVAGLNSQDLNSQRDLLFAPVQAVLDQQYRAYGVQILSVDAKDISFPKSIQEVFAKQLEAQVRSRADLENARTQVAVARTLKNASELTQNDPNMRFYQWLETLTKIASRGSHTFVVGELPPSPKGT